MDIALIQVIAVSGILGFLIGYLVGAMTKVIVAVIAIVVILLVVVGLTVTASFPSIPTLFQTLLNYIQPIYQIITSSLPWSALSFAAALALGFIVEKR